MTVDIICADAREALARFPDGHFHCCVTSPPFWGLRDYGLGPDALGLEPTPELFCEHLVAVMREVRRVLRDDGTLWLNLGDSYNAAGRDGHGTRIGYKQRMNRASATGADGNRPTAPSLKPKDLVGVPWMVAFALRADGWWLRSDIVWSKPNPMPESVTDRPTRSHEYLFLLAKSARYYYDADAIREPLAPASIERISQSTFDEQTGGPKDYRTTGVNRHRSARQGLEGLAKRYRSGNKERKLEVPTRPNDHRGSSVPWEDNGTGRNRRSVWEIATQPFPGAHFAVFPEKLVEPCILAGCPEGGTVLDPFAGSGTVGVVAERLGRHSVLIDAKEEYVAMARHRTAQRGLMVEAVS